MHSAHSTEPTRSALVPVDRPSYVLGQRTGTRIRLVGRTLAETIPLDERRRAERLSPASAHLTDTGRLRTGHELRVLDISTTGVRIEAPVRMQVGGRIELCLTENGTDQKLVVTGVARRCYVASLDPLVYTGAVEFDQALDLTALLPFVTEAQSA